jgi:DNA-directed RNA polymerase I, II, and III subunit RPABC5
MIIPVKCFTCGKVIGDKYRAYLERVRERKIGGGQGAVNKVVYLTPENKTHDKSPEGLAMDSLGIHKMCCRRHFLTHVDI